MHKRETFSKTQRTHTHTHASILICSFILHLQSTNQKVVAIIFKKIPVYLISGFLFLIILLSLLLCVHVHYDKVLHICVQCAYRVLYPMFDKNKNLKSLTCGQVVRASQDIYIYIYVWRLEWPLRSLMVTHFRTCFFFDTEKKRVKEKIKTQIQKPRITQPEITCRGVRRASRYINRYTEFNVFLLIYDKSLPLFMPFTWNYIFFHKTGTYESILDYFFSSVVAAIKAAGFLGEF